VTDEGRTYAGLGPRFVALVVDFAIFCAVFFPVGRLVKGVWLMTHADHLWRSGSLVMDPLCIIFFVVIVAYYVLFEGLAGWTPGKLVAGIRVIDEAGRPPGLRRSLVRNALRLVDGLPFLNLIGVLLILASPERARFGDRVAGTRVVVAPTGSD